MSGKKETVLDLGKFIDKGVRVKLSGGREGACPTGPGPPRRVSFHSCVSRPIPAVFALPPCVSCTGDALGERCLTEGVFPFPHSTLAVPLPPSLTYVPHRWSLASARLQWLAR